MNNKGFTLVELLAVLVLLALVLGLGATVIGSGFGKTKEKTEEVFVEIIGDALDITEADDTNVMKHINAVLRLESYEKYNDVRKCISNSASKYTDCLDYINKAGSSSSYYVIKLYVGYAHTYAQSALSSARTYSSGDYLCTQYVNALDTIEEELSDLYYDYGYYSSSSVSSAMSTIHSLVSDVSDAEDSVENIIGSIPSIN